jgi:hypothetical protein
MKINAKIVLAFLCIAVASNALANKYSYMEEFTNQTNQPIIIQNADAGSERWIKEYSNPCVTGGDNRDVRVDCQPFVIPANKTYKFNNMVIPWQKVNGKVVPGNVIWVTLFVKTILQSGYVIEKKIWTLQEVDGKVVVYESKDDGATWQQVSGSGQDTGQFSFTVSEAGNFNIKRW